MKSNKKALLASLAAIGTGCVLIGGATFALFTSDSTTNIAVTSGKVDVRAVVDEESLTLYSMGEKMEETFATGGTATYTKESNSFNLDKIVAGDHIEFDVEIKNYSTVAVKYQSVLTFNGDADLFKALDVTMGDLEFVSMSDALYTSWSELAVGQDGLELHVAIGIPETYEDTIVNGDDTNSVQGKNCSIIFNVTAVQGNADTSFMPVASAEDFVNTLNDGGKASLKDDVVLSQAYQAKSNQTLVINGNGKTLSNNNVGGEAIYNNRVINVQEVDNVSLTLNNVNIDAADKERGISMYGSHNVTVDVNKSTVTAEKYALNIANYNTNVKLNVVDSVIQGWAAIQTYSAGSIINVENSTLKNVDQFGSLFGWNTFAAIVLETNARGSQVNIKNSRIEVATSPSGDPQYFASIRCTGAELVFENCTFVKDGVELTDVQDILRNLQYYQNASKLVINGSEII